MRKNAFEPRLWLVLLTMTGCADFGRPSLDGDQVIFHASSGPPFSPPVFDGIYRSSGGCLVPVADRKTQVPGGTGTFESFGPRLYLPNGSSIFLLADPSFDEGEVAFWGGWGGGSQEGIYLRSGDSIRVIADRSTARPRGNGNFAAFNRAFDTAPSLNGGSVAFSSNSAIYLHDGNTIRVVMDEETLMPGVPENFRVHSGFSAGDGNVVAFKGGVPHRAEIGVYQDDSGSLRVVADYNTIVPGRSHRFGAFWGVSAAGRHIAFVGGKWNLVPPGSGFIPYGIYLATETALTLVADTNTAVPGGTGNFDDFGEVATDGESVVFVGQTGSWHRGIYLYSGGSLSRIVDTNTPIPGLEGTPTFFRDLSLDAGDVVFLSGGFPLQGVYRYRGSSLAMIADTRTPVPGGTGNFVRFDDVDTDSGDVGFVVPGWSEGGGVYLYSDGVLSRVVDPDTPVPGGSGNFTDFLYLELDSGNIAFQGGRNTTETGIYLYSGGSLAVVADEHTAVPGKPDYAFADFFDFTADEGNVAFVANSVSASAIYHLGVYLNDGNTMRPVVDRNASFPGGTGSISGFTDLSLDGSRVTFIGRGQVIAGPQGIYRQDGAGIRVVADYNTVIPGGTGTFDGFGDGVSADGAEVAFVGWESGPFGLPTGAGIYLEFGGALSVVVDTNTAVPEGVGNFTGFLLGPEGLQGGDVVFLGTDERNIAGVYLKASGSLSVVADDHSPPMGSLVLDPSRYAPSLHQGNVAFSGSNPTGIFWHDGNMLRVIASAITPIPPLPCTPALP